ncbi:MAG: hypothetical protein LUP99_02600 [Methanomicrobiales archaeon]|nr:hypothetical protein [Methanomicrobiales archaeon]
MVVRSSLFRYYAMAGMAIAGISLFLLSSFALQRNLWLIISGFIPLTIGGALFQNPNNAEIIMALPIDESESHPASMRPSVTWEWPWACHLQASS